MPAASLCLKRVSDPLATALSAAGARSLRAPSPAAPAPPPPPAAVPDTRRAPAEPAQGFPCVFLQENIPFPASDSLALLCALLALPLCFFA